MIQDEELLHYFQRGLIPGPAETEETFLQRAQLAVALSYPAWNEVAPLTRAQFGFTLDWAALTYSNKDIRPWEGAVTWISEDGLPSIQLRTAFQKGAFLGYKRNDILAHEAVHAARMKFEEPQFEEILAYSLSPQRWKRFWGPLFSRPWEPLCFAGVFLLASWSLVIPLVAAGLWSGFLFFRQWIFRKCYQRFPLSVVLCLKDAEIRKMGWKSNFVVPQDSTPRTRLIYLLLDKAKDCREL